MNVLTRTVVGWARRVHESGLRNARAAATECSRRRVERAEVEAFLAHARETASRAVRATSTPALLTGVEAGAPAAVGLAGH